MDAGDDPSSSNHHWLAVWSDPIRLALELYRRAFVCLRDISPARGSPC